MMTMVLHENRSTFERPARMALAGDSSVSKCRLGRVCSLFLLLLFVACSTVSAQPLDQPMVHTYDEVDDTCLKPQIHAAATYAMIMGFPTLLLKPADGWICRCLLLSKPLCTCALSLSAEDDSEKASEIHIYFDDDTWNNYPRYMLGF